jgi:hypothetical protein
VLESKSFRFDTLSFLTGRYKRICVYTIQCRGTVYIASTQMRRRLEESHTPSLRLSHSGLGIQTGNHATFIPPIINPVQPRR